MNNAQKFQILDKNSYCLMITIVFIRNNIRSNYLLEKKGRTNEEGLLEFGTFKKMLATFYENSSVN